MKRLLNIWQILGFAFTAIMGVLLHFLYEWTGGSNFVAPFSAVNESIWEHMKLLFFPMFIFACIEKWYIGKDYKNFWCVKLLGIMLGIILIPVLYYTLNGIFGKIPDWINIAIFFVTAAISYFVETKLLNKHLINCKYSTTALLIMWIIAFLFGLFTFTTPQIPLFK